MVAHVPIFHVVAYWQGRQEEVIKTYFCRSAANLYVRFTSLLERRFRSDSVILRVIAD